MLVDVHGRKIGSNNDDGFCIHRSKPLSNESFYEYMYSYRQNQILFCFRVTQVESVLNSGLCIEGRAGKRIESFSMHFFSYLLAIICSYIKFFIYDYLNEFNKILFVFYFNTN